MSLFVAILLVLIGFGLLIWSADVLVDNASELAGKLGVSTFLIGVVIVGFGTSAPELFVSAVAALEDKGNLALGNALGSNITNIGLVLGAAAVVRMMPVSRSTATRDVPMVIIAGLISVALLMDGTLSHIDGFILLIMLVSYLIYSAKASVSTDIDATDSGKSTAVSAAWTVGSIIVLMIASRLLVTGAVSIANHFDVSELVIGLTIIAIGTSLPELAAAVAAARKGVHDMIIGNIIGSNVFNTLGVLGLTGAIRSTEINNDVLVRDFPIMFAFTVFMLFCALKMGRFGRKEGVIMLSGYGAYLGFLLLSA